MNNQKPEKRIRNHSGLYHLHSIFDTIQGEGPFAGRPAVFIRLAGCNLQCPFCDTKYTERTFVDHTNIVGEVQRLRPAGWLVVITGGEPFRQDLEDLLFALHKAGYTVQIETNGTLPPSEGAFNIICNSRYTLNPILVVCSPKTGLVNPMIMQIASCYKYVLDADSQDTDGLPVLALGHSAHPVVAKPHDKALPVYLQPMDTGNAHRNRINVEAVKRACLKHGYILQLQIHKLINVE